MNSNTNNKSATGLILLLIIFIFLPIILGAYALFQIYDAKVYRNGPTIKAFVGSGISLFLLLFFQGGESEPNGMLMFSSIFGLVLCCAALFWNYKLYAKQEIKL